MFFLFVLQIRIHFRNTVILHLWFIFLEGAVFDDTCGFSFSFVNFSFKL